ncbi:hypothetical protein IW261DRAFT_1597696 [Armillaria novae-zelandiae]|uniref:Uncharacterized protein n=1 Tax=Armillaria novae-zelandiae TaxID=153914 RepID=A0AA39TTY9_9AGAR|nr:hypothetical protein IW261DRAFT_1613643 [Armillaria novae-zelandiae]KAK0470745.1 hypothetical protein IW261DRAFT_1597696 [Armillaria novae-zelandiae]
MLAAIFGACGMAPPPAGPERLRNFVFDVVAFRDTLIRSCPKQWALVLADARVTTNRQLLSFDFKPSPEDPGRLIEVDIPGSGFGLDNWEYPDCNVDRARARLEREAWIQPKTVRPQTVQCAACKKQVHGYPNRPEYDMMRWQDHRDYCPDIRHQMKVCILRTLLPRRREFIHPPNSKDPVEIVPPEVSRNLLEGHPEIMEFAGNKDAIKSLLAMYS